MKLGLNPVLVVEASITDKDGKTEPLAGQVFYILEKSPDHLLKAHDVKSEIGYARIMNALRNHADEFVVTDSLGKAKEKGLKEGAYYICGVHYTQYEAVVWNIAIELKPGDNLLVLNGENMTRT
jgi:hypothetical protein